MIARKYQCTACPGIRWLLLLCPRLALSWRRSLSLIWSEIGLIRTRLGRNDLDQSRKRLAAPARPRRAVVRCCPSHRSPLIKGSEGIQNDCNVYGFLKQGTLYGRDEAQRRCN